MPVTILWVRMFITRIAAASNVRQAVSETLQWRMIATVIDFVLFYLVTGEPYLALGLASVDAIVKTTAFFFWRLKWSSGSRASRVQAKRR